MVSCAGNHKAELSFSKLPISNLPSHRSRSFPSALKQCTSPFIELAWWLYWEHVATEPQSLGLPDVQGFGAHAMQNYDSYWWLYIDLVYISLTLGIPGSENLICSHIVTSLYQIRHRVLFIHLKWMEPDCRIDLADVCAVLSVYSGAMTLRNVHVQGNFPNSIYIEKRTA